MAQAVQLLARGIQDEWLSGKPQVSFYRSQFKRNVPFGSSVEQFVVPVDGKIIINAKGDLIGYTYLTAHDINTGALVPNVNWSTVISSVDLVIGNQVIATHDMTYINTIQKALDSDTYSKRSQTNTFQPLGFFFDKQPLPIAALKYTDVKINITWASAAVSKQYVYKCWSHCIRLSGDERMFFATQAHRILIPCVQRVPISAEPYFSGPVKYIAAPCTNYVGAYYNPIPLNITTYNIVSPINQNASFGAYIYSVFWARGVDLYVYNADETLFGTFPKTTAADDSFVIKSDKATGQVQWVVRIGGTNFDDPYFLDFDTAGNVYITGATNSNPIIFYSTNGTSVSLASPSAFLVKYDSNGIVQWATRTFRGNCRGLSTEGSNVYISGYFTSTTITAYDTPGTTSSIPAINRITSSDGYIVKYNSSGQAQWMTTISGVAITSFCHMLRADSTGIYYAGLYSGPIITIYDANGVPSSLSSISVPSGKNTNIVVKYSFSGQAIWFTQTVGDIYSFSSTHRLNLYKNSLYLSLPVSAGGTVSLYDSQNSLNSNVTNTDSVLYKCLVRYDQEGKILWSVKHTDGMISSVYDNSGDIMIYIRAPQASVYDANGNVINLYGDNLTNVNMFIVRYNSDGKITGTRKITGLDDPTLFSLASLDNYLFLGVNTNSFYRVYDTGSDSEYQTIQTGNIQSVYVKVSGATI